MDSALKYQIVPDFLPLARGTKRFNAIKKSCSTQSIISLVSNLYPTHVIMKTSSGLGWEK